MVLEHVVPSVDADFSITIKCYFARFLKEQIVCHIDGGNAQLPCIPNKLLADEHIVDIVTLDSHVDRFDLLMPFQKVNKNISITSVQRQKVTNVA